MRSIVPPPDAFAGLAATLTPIARLLGENHEAAEQLEPHWILPHRTTPWHLYDKGMPEAFPEAVLRH